MSDDEDIRTKISNMPLGQVLELKSKIGTTNFNHAVFGDSKSDNKQTNVKSTKRNPQRDTSDDEDAPMEMTSKRPVPFLGSDSLSKRKRKERESKIRDPRFDRRCGDYSSAQFRENFEFVFDLKTDELKTLKQQLKECRDTEERERLKFVIQRTQNQLREHQKQLVINKRNAEEKGEIEKARSEGRRPFYVKKSEKRMVELVDKFEELKESGRLKKHIEKRRKKSAGQSKKKMNL